MELFQIRSGFFSVEGFPMFRDGGVNIETGVPHAADACVIGVIVIKFQSAVLIEKEFCIAESFSQHLRDIRDQLRGDRAGKRIARHIIEPE